MDYENWRQDVFGQNANSNPVDIELREETHNISCDETLDYVNRALTDTEIHNLFSKEQIGIGLQLIYDPTCSDISSCYVEVMNEERRVSAIQNMSSLYRNYFEKYCISGVKNIGNDCQADGAIGYLCYMLWDIFLLYPGNSSRRMTAAAIEVMSEALESSNDNCLVSAIHGLGHWVDDVPEAAYQLSSWLENPTSQNKAILEYANQAKIGCIQ